MPGIYGGDDVSAIVVDPGSSLLRAGWAGEDTPRVVIPSAYGWIADDANSAVPSITATNGADGDVSMTETPTDPALSGENGAAKSAATEEMDARTRIAKYSAKKQGEAKGKKRYFGDMGVNTWRKGMEIGEAVTDGVVSSISDFYPMVNYAYDNLSADSTEHPLLLTESTWTPREMREELTEMAFEGLGVPAYYLANSTVLSSFSAGKPTALIVDAGYSSVSAIPVVDGFVIRKGILRQPTLGGAGISKALDWDFKNPPARSPRAGGPVPEYVPTYRVKSKQAVDAGAAAQWESRESRVEGTTESFKRYHEEKILHEAKESLCQVLEQPWDENLALSRPSRPFEFPNGYNDVFGIERFRASEIIFHPEVWTGVEGILPQSSTNPISPLGQMVLDSVSSVDIDSRPNLLSNIVCVGGSTFIPGFVDRLSYELSVRAPAQKIKMHSPGNSVERRHSSWLGGSILASLGSFHQVWISKQEYEEHGSAIVNARAR